MFQCVLRSCFPLLNFVLQPQKNVVKLLNVIRLSIRHPQRFRFSNFSKVPLNFYLVEIFSGGGGFQDTPRAILYQLSSIAPYTWWNLYHPIVLES